MKLKGSALQFELRQDIMLLQRRFGKPSIMEEYPHTDSLVSTNNVNNTSNNLGPHETNLTNTSDSVGTS